MRTIPEVIEQIIAGKKARNAAHLAVLTAVTEATVSRWKSGDRVPDDEQAVKLAEILGIEAGEVLAECGAARAKTPETRKAWERVAARMAAYSITLCLGIMSFGQSEEARASSPSYDMPRLTVFRTLIMPSVRCDPSRDEPHHTLASS